MAIYPGSVPVGGYLAPTDTTDTFAVTDSQFSRGGHHEVANSSERAPTPTACTRGSPSHRTGDSAHPLRIPVPRKGNSWA